MFYKVFLSQKVVLSIHESVKLVYYCTSYGPAAKIRKYRNEFDTLRRDTSVASGANQRSCDTDSLQVHSSYSKIFFNTNTPKKDDILVVYSNWSRNFNVPSSLV